MTSNFQKRAYSIFAILQAYRIAKMQSTMTSNQTKTMAIQIYCHRRIIEDEKNNN
jgi:hypothetical protein